MLDDVSHNQCVQDMDVDRVTAEVAEDQAMVAEDQAMVAEDQAMVADVTEMDPLETNTNEEVVHVHHTEDKTVITKRNGNLTLKDKD